VGVVEVGFHRPSRDAILADDDREAVREARAETARPRPRTAPEGVA
jgi:hypothetical protein